MTAAPKPELVLTEEAEVRLSYIAYDVCIAGERLDGLRIACNDRRRRERLEAVAEELRLASVAIRQLLA